MQTKPAPNVVRDFNYHRNGVGGRGFFCFVAEISFELMDGTYEPRESYLVTWFPPDGYGSKYKQDRPEGQDQWDTGYEVAFIPLDEAGRPIPDKTMRGDRLICQIREQIRKAYLKRYP